MKYQPIAIGLLFTMIAGGLAACGSTETATSTTPASTKTATTAIATVSAPTAQPTSAAIVLGVSGIGTVKAVQDADLVFQSQGTVEEVHVREGDQVKKGDLLAILDVRGFDQQVQQAEAALASADAANAALTEAPRSFDAAAANAAVANAVAQLDEVKSGAKEQDIRSAEAAVTAAQASLQSTQDQLSQAKTTAEKQLAQAVESLTAAQAAYARAKSNWEVANGSGNDPVVPDTTTSSGASVPNKLSDGQLEAYYLQFLQAETTLRSAEQAVQIAQVAADTARQVEINGVKAAEQQVVQAQQTLDKLKLPPDQSQLAAAQAALAQAKANRDSLTAAPRDSQKAQADANIAQAQAALEQARISRERAELRAPFDGVIAVVNVDPGDPSSSGNPAIQIVDVSTLEIEVQISDVDIDKVKIGQEASVFADALPGTTIKGTVGFIAPTATVQGTLRSYKVRIDLPEPGGLRAGMSVRVELAN